MCFYEWETIAFVIFHFYFKKLLPIEKSQEVKAVLLSSLTINFPRLYLIFLYNLYLDKIILLHLQLLSFFTVSSLTLPSNHDFASNEITFFSII